MMDLLKLLDLTATHLIKVIRHDDLAGQKSNSLYLPRLGRPKTPRTTTLC
jgi:hypothetical protein